MIEIVKPTITKEIDENGQYGKFVVEPLERGYGTTLGNCMRRIHSQLFTRMQLSLLSRLTVYSMSSQLFQASRKMLQRLS